MKTRTAELIIQEYIYDLREPKFSLKRSYFKQRSYSIWAAEEALRTIRKRKDVNPIYAMEEFVGKMDYYACHRPDLSYIFSVAYDIGTDILDRLMAAN